MSQNYRYTGVKISQYPFAEINTTNHKNKFNHQHYFISYAPANYGISDINKNFKVPIDAIRKDMIGYIGLSNSKAGWRDYINFWEGDWYNYDGGDWYDYSSENKDIIEKTRSYVYEWDYANEFHKLDFIYNKHGLYPKWDKENDIHRVYLLNTAPLPLEAEDTHFSTKKEKNYGFDPNPNSVKFVSKTYVDDRHCGDRKIDIHDYYYKINDSNQYILKDDDKTHLHEDNPSHLTIRPYTCFYQYTNLPEIDNDGCYYIDIWDDCILEDFRMIKKSQEEIDQEKANGVKEPEEFKKVYTTFYDKVKHNRLVFYLRIKNRPEFYYQNDINEDNETYKKHCNNLKIKVKGKDNVVLWSYEDEWTEILREHRLKLEEESGNTINTTKNYIFLKCEAEYIKNVNNEDVFTVTCSSFFGRKKAIKRIVEVPIKDGKSVNLDLSLHENECFITQVPDDEIIDQNPIYIDQAVINFTNLDKLDDYHVYSWDYFVITPDHEYDDADKYKVRKDYNYLLFRGAPILWADCDAFNISPDFQPNKMYCLEFVKAFDGCLIGRIKYYVSLVKKS